MTDNTSAVDANLGVATDQAGVETSPKAPEVDTDLLESVLKTTIEQRDKAIIAAENWKKVGMARKNGTANEPITPELTEDDIEVRANLRAQEIIAQKATETAKAAETRVLELLKANRELKIANQNKAGIVTSAPMASSGNNVAPVAQGHGWSNDQIAEMKRRGVDTTKDFLQKSWERFQKSK